MIGRRARCDYDARPAFASCGHAAALALGSNVPEAKILLFDHLVGAGEQRGRNFEAEPFSGFYFRFPETTLK